MDIQAANIHIYTNTKYLKNTDTCSMAYVTKVVPDSKGADSGVAPKKIWTMVRGSELGRMGSLSLPIDSST